MIRKLQRYRSNWKVSGLIKLAESLNKLDTVCSNRLESVESLVKHWCQEQDIYMDGWIHAQMWVVVATPLILYLQIQAYSWSTEGSNVPIRNVHVNWAKAILYSYFIAEKYWKGILLCVLCIRVPGDEKNMLGRSSEPEGYTHALWLCS